MSDDIPPAQQHRCTDSGCEHQKYFVDIFSYVQPGQEGRNWSRKQLFLYIARDVESSRKSFLQEEHIRLGLIKVHSDRFCWSKETQAGMLIAQLEMGDFLAVKKVERRKINEMKLPEKLTFTLPPCDASFMKIVTRMLSDSHESLLETEQLNVNLSLIPQRETKPGVEHGCRTNQPTEN